MIEAVARHVSEAVSNATAFDVVRRSPTHRDPVTGLPSHHHVQHFVAAELAGCTDGRASSLVLIRIEKSADGGGSHAPSPNVILSAIRKELRGADLLFHYRDEEFVIFLTGAGREAAEAVSARISRGLVAVETVRTDSYQFGLSIATGPEDGTTLEALLSIARYHAKSLNAASASAPSANTTPASNSVVTSQRQSVH